MSYTPIVARLADVQTIPGADRVVSATASGYRLVVGAEHVNGELGVVFPSEGVIDLDFAVAAELLREDPITGAKLSGYLDNPARVRCLTIRGVRTEALWIPLADFVRAVAAVMAKFELSVDLARLVDGYQFVDGVVPASTSLQLPPDFKGYSVARKYVPPPAFVRSGGGAGKPLSEAERLSRAQLNAVVPRHYDTPRLQSTVYRFPVNSLVRATAKLHGTSGRTGKASMPERLPRYKRMLNRVAGLIGRQLFSADVIVSGTRETLRLHSKPRPNEQPDMRRDVAEWLAPKLRPGEVVYYELVGFYSNGKPIQVQRPHEKGAESKALKKRWGDAIVYAYGCDPNGEPIRPGRPYPVPVTTPTRVGEMVSVRKPRHRVFAYRITDHGRELPFDMMRQRALEIGIEVPREVGRWHHIPPAAFQQHPDATIDEQIFAVQRAAGAETVRRAIRLAEGDTGCLPDLLDPSHPFEGVVLRVDLGAHVGAEHLTAKCKSHGFGLLEGYGKDRGEVDPEEAGPDELVDE